MAREIDMVHQFSLKLGDHTGAGGKDDIVHGQIAPRGGVERIKGAARGDSCGDAALGKRCQGIEIPLRQRIVGTQQGSVEIGYEESFVFIVQNYSPNPFSAKQGRNFSQPKHRAMRRGQTKSVSAWAYLLVFPTKFPVSCPPPETTMLTVIRTVAKIMFRLDPAL